MATPVTEDEIMDTLRKVKNRKACIPGGGEGYTPSLIWSTYCVVWEC